MQKETAKQAADLVVDIAKCAASLHTAKGVLSMFDGQPEKNALECEHLRAVITENERDIEQSKKDLADLFEKNIPAFGDIRVVPGEQPVNIIAAQPQVADLRQ